MYGADVVDIVKRHLGTELTVPVQVTRAKPLPVTKLLKIEYIGSVKEREDGSMTAMGYCEDNWSVVLKLKVLREWFEGNGDEPVKPEDAPTRYAILGIKRKASNEEIRKAHRIAAKTWHPDKNDEDTTEQFRLIQDAYEVLSDNQQRRKYDAALYFEAQAGRQPQNADSFSISSFGIWKLPKRCGWLTVECEEMLGRFIVSRIMRWDDIMDGHLTMISYWPKRGNKFEVDWI
jgi:hypothetical protein